MFTIDLYLVFVQKWINHHLNMTTPNYYLLGSEYSLLLKVYLLLFTLEWIFTSQEWIIPLKRLAGFRLCERVSIHSFTYLKCSYTNAADDILPVRHVKYICCNMQQFFYFNIFHVQYSTILCLFLIQIYRFYFK